MSRLLNGTSDEIVASSISPTLDITGALTFLVVVKWAADGTWGSLIEAHSGGSSFTMTRTNSNKLRAADESAFSDGTNNFVIADGWQIIAITKATGSATPDGHKMPIGGARSTQAHGSAIGSGNLNADTVRLGGNDDFASMRIAVAAIFTKVLTTTELDGILSAKTTASINALGPVWLADDGNNFASVLVGTGTMSVGGTDSADEPAGWVYGLAGGTDYTGTVPAAAAATGSVPQPVVTSLVRPYIAITVA